MAAGWENEMPVFDGVDGSPPGRGSPSTDGHSSGKIRAAGWRRSSRTIGRGRGASHSR